MSKLLALSALLSLCATAACVSAEETPDDPSCNGGKCDDASQSCADPGYGDGVCQPVLTCEVPDLDCFQTATSDEDAIAWFSALEMRLAAEEQRAPRNILAPSDPRAAKARAWLDQAWQLFRRHRPVGALAGRHVGLVVIDDPSPNAFVAPEIGGLGRSVLVVMVHTGLLASPDHGAVAIMMHELQHAVGLHLIPGGKDRMRRFYVNQTEDGEDVGRLQAEDVFAAESGGRWRHLAAKVGPFADAALGGLPLRGMPKQVLDYAVQLGAMVNPNGCAQARSATAQALAQLRTGIDPLTSALTVPVGFSGDAVLAIARDSCLAGVTNSFVEFGASAFGVTPEVFAQNLTAEELALVSGRHVVDAVAALTGAARAQMRQEVADFEQLHARGWNNLRYFSYEEDADDVGAVVARDAGMDTSAMADGLLENLLGPADRERCTALLDAGQLPPYGADLSDEHHATCWRAHHARQLAESDLGLRRRATAARPAARAAVGAAGGRYADDVRLTDLLSHRSRRAPAGPGF